MLSQLQIDEVIKHKLCKDTRGGEETAFDAVCEIHCTMEPLRKMIFSQIQDHFDLIMANNFNLFFLFTSHFCSVVL